MERLETQLNHIAPNNNNNEVEEEVNKELLVIENTLGEEVPEEYRIFGGIKEAPPDAIFGVKAAYIADPYPDKINLSVGAYRTEDGKPWVLPVVKKVEAQLLVEEGLNKEYLPIEGLLEFREAAPKLILGKNSPVIRDGKICAVQGLGGTGSLRLGMAFISQQFDPKPTIYIANPTWANHKKIVNHSGLEYEYYRYYDKETKSLDLDGFLEDINSAPSHSVFLLHAVAHNPTGVDPSPGQWELIIEALMNKQHFIYFDCAYQGFASGDLDRDAYAVRLAVSRGLELFVAQSFSKNMGFYGERVGCLTVVCKTNATAKACLTQLKSIIRGLYSNPPSHGARCAEIILRNPSLYNEWVSQLKRMSERILSMRRLLYECLKRNNTPGQWTHVITQIGMFTYTGLSESQVEIMKSKHHVYMTSNGRISIAGLNRHNAPYVANAIHDVVTNYAE